MENLTPEQVKKHVGEHCQVWFNFKSAEMHNKIDGEIRGVLSIDASGRLGLSCEKGFCWISFDEFESTHYMPNGELVIHVKGR